MDRTSILGDTIDYMKELLHNINNLQEEMNLGENDLGLFKNSKPEEALIRNSPKVITCTVIYLNSFFFLIYQSRWDSSFNIFFKKYKKVKKGKFTNCMW